MLDLVETCLMEHMSESHTSCVIGAVKFHLKFEHSQ